MKSRRNEKAIEVQLQDLVDRVVLKPEQKQLAIRAMNSLMHATRTEDVKALRKAMDKFLKLLLRA